MLLHLLEASTIPELQLHSNSCFLTGSIHSRNPSTLPRMSPPPTLRTLKQQNRNTYRGDTSNDSETEADTHRINKGLEAS